MSAGVACFVHLIAPVFRSIAMTASLDGCGGPLYVLPVATYSMRRFASIVGADQMADPDGPQSGTPAELFPRGAGMSATVYVFQMTAPVFASSAVTLPRNVQHAYCGSAPCDSSYDEVGTYRRSSKSAGVPVMRASGWLSTLRIQ